VLVDAGGGLKVKLQTDSPGPVSDRTKEALRELARGVAKIDKPCAFPGCEERIALDRVACKPHWYELPKPLLERWAAVKSTGTPMQRAQVLREALTLLKKVPPIACSKCKSPIAKFLQPGAVWHPCEKCNGQLCEKCCERKAP